jgi:hypothetical protein
LWRAREAEPGGLDPVEEAGGDGRLGGPGELLDGCGVDQGGVGVVGPEGGVGALDVVEDDQVEVLGLQLAAGPGQVVAGLGGEADQDLVGPAAAAQLGQGVRGRLEHDLGDAPVLLELALGDPLGPEVGHRGRHHQHVLGVGAARTAS